MNDKIITVLLAILIALSGWSLSTTVGLKSDVAVLNEKVSKLEKDVESFNSATSKVYREALRKDVNETPNKDLSKILPIIHDNRPARNIIQSKENEDWEGKTVKSSIKKALTKKPKKKSVKKTSGKKN